jgi:cbb3-type cytochrome oxidase subunit 3
MSAPEALASAGLAAFAVILAGCFLALVAILLRR